MMEVVVETKLVVVVSTDVLRYFQEAKAIMVMVMEVSGLYGEVPSSCIGLQGSARENAWKLSDICYGWLWEEQHTYCKLE